MKKIYEEIEVIDFGLPEMKEGVRTTWHSDGRVLVEYPSDYDPFGGKLTLRTVDKNGEMMPMWRYHDINFRLRLKEFNETGKVPKGNLA